MACLRKKNIFDVSIMSNFTKVNRSLKHLILGKYTWEICKFLEHMALLDALVSCQLSTTTNGTPCFDDYDCIHYPFNHCVIWECYSDEEINKNLIVAAICTLSLNSHRHVVAIFSARGEKARFRMRVTRGVILIRSLVYTKHVPEWFRSGPGVAGS